MKIVQHLRAKNDTNGNPRRIWALYDVESVNRVSSQYYDEGYRGKPEECRNLPEIPSVAITPAEYRDFSKLADFHWS